MYTVAYSNLRRIIILVMQHFANSSSLNAEFDFVFFNLKKKKKKKKKKKEKLTADLIVIPPHAESVPKQTLFCTIPDRPTCRKRSKTNSDLNCSRQTPMQKMFQNKLYSRQTHMQKVFQNKPRFALFQTDPHAESVPKQTLF